MAVTVPDIQIFKERGERFVMRTCYDSTSSRLLDEAGTPLIFIGDTLGGDDAGYSSTVPFICFTKQVDRTVRKG